MSESLSKRFWNIAVVRLLEKLQCTPADEKHINPVREQSESSSWCSIHHKVLRSTRRVGRATWTRPHIATSPIRTKHGYGCRCVWCPRLHKMFYSIKLRCSTHAHTVSPALPMCWCATSCQSCCCNTNCTNRQPGWLPDAARQAATGLEVPKHPVYALQRTRQHDCSLCPHHENLTWHCWAVKTVVGRVHTLCGCWKWTLGATHGGQWWVTA